MSDTEESLIDRAMRQAKEASAAALGAGVAGGVAQGIAPGTFTYHTARPAAAQAFVEAFQGLADNNTRLQVASHLDQTTVQFMQHLPTGNWASAVTVTLMQAADEIKVTTSGQNLTALASVAGDLGGTALGVVGDLLSGPLGVVNALGRVSREAGKVAGAASDLNLSGQVRSIVERLGRVMDEEWIAVQHQKREADDRQRAASTCPYCGTPYPSDDTVTCPNCHAPRSK